MISDLHHHVTFVTLRQLETVLERVLDCNRLEVYLPVVSRTPPRPIGVVDPNDNNFHDDTWIEGGTHGPAVRLCLTKSTTL